MTLRVACGAFTFTPGKRTAIGQRGRRNDVGLRNGVLDQFVDGNTMFTMRGVVLAKTEHPDHITKTAMMCRAGTPVVALIESAVGLMNAYDIARAPGVFRLAFGVGDFRKDTGASGDPMALAFARSTLVTAARVGELPGPIDGPSGGASGEQLAAACRVNQSMGMTGKLTLDPAQTDDINHGLSPSEQEIHWARDMIEQASSGHAGADGSYLPRLARARKVSELAETYGLWNS